MEWGRTVVELLDAVVRAAGRLQNLRHQLLQEDLHVVDTAPPLEGLELFVVRRVGVVRVHCTRERKGVSRRCKSGTWVRRARAHVESRNIREGHSQKGIRGSSVWMRPRRVQREGEGRAHRRRGECGPSRPRPSCPGSPGKHCSSSRDPRRPSRRSRRAPRAARCRPSPRTPSGRTAGSAPQPSAAAPARAGAVSAGAVAERSSGAAATAAGSGAAGLVCSTRDSEPRMGDSGSRDMSTSTVSAMAVRLTCAAAYEQLSAPIKIPSTHPEQRCSDFETALAA